LLPVAMDAQGMLPSALESLLSRRRAEGLRMPRAMYVIPSGQNPTGAAMGPARRAEIYEVARRYDLVIVEDDAYSWLQYPDGEGAVPGLAGLQRERLAAGAGSRGRHSVEAGVPAAFECQSPCNSRVLTC
jgi:DNA-binding transcriptional MocR family regulator